MYSVTFYGICGRRDVHVRDHQLNMNISLLQIFFSQMDFLLEGESFPSLHLNGAGRDAAPVASRGEPLTLHHERQRIEGGASSNFGIV
jgi:hypothetical protein